MAELTEKNRPADVDLTPCVVTQYGGPQQLHSLTADKRSQWVTGTDYKRKKHSKGHKLGQHIFSALQNKAKQMIKY